MRCKVSRLELVDLLLLKLNAESNRFWTIWSFHPTETIHFTLCFMIVHKYMLNTFIIGCLLDEWPVQCLPCSETLLCFWAILALDVCWWQCLSITPPTIHHSYITKAIHILDPRKTSNHFAEANGDPDSNCIMLAMICNANSVVIVIPFVPFSHAFETG